MFGNLPDGTTEAVSSLTYWGTGLGTFSAPTPIPTVSCADVAVGDADGDRAFAERDGSTRLRLRVPGPDRRAAWGGGWIVLETPDANGVAFKSKIQASTGPSRRGFAR